MIPTSLCQYTNIESVKKILENKTIRFTRLDCLNDPLEGIHGDYSNLNVCKYISSWTAVDAESLPMWHMYSKLNGVRIKFPINLFKADDELKVSLLENGRWHIVSELANPITLEHKPELPQIQNDVPKKMEDLFTISKVYGPSKISYLSSIEMENYQSKIMKYDINAKSTVPIYLFDPNMIGLNKNSEWSYENEYRYWLKLPEVKFIAGSENIMRNYDGLVENRFVDIKFDERIIKKIEITLGPSCSENDEKELKNYAIDLGYDSIKISKSIIAIREKGT